MDLARTQRRLWRLLTAPEGVRAALAEEGDASGASLEGWLRSAPGPAAAVRLEIYANAYFARIHGVMVEDFGALARALGEAGFHDLVTAYLCVHPPERPSLRHVGERLPGFLADHGAAAPFRRRWPFAADLARLEVALADAFDAPDAPALTREDLASVPPERWADLSLTLHPSVRLLRIGSAALALRRAFEADAEPAPGGGVVPAVVWRRRVVSR